MRILGIDPGFGRVGYAVVEFDGPRLRAVHFGCLETKAGQALAARLCIIQKTIGQLLKRWKPDAVAVEELFFAKNVKTALQVAHARGVVLAAVAAVATPLIEMKPAEVKQTVTGSGNADKGQVQRMVQKLFALPEPPKPDDAADALAVALTGGLLWRMKNKQEQVRVDN